MKNTGEKRQCTSIYTRRVCPRAYSCQRLRKQRRPAHYVRRGGGSGGVVCMCNNKRRPLRLNTGPPRHGGTTANEQERNSANPIPRCTVATTRVRRDLRRHGDRLSTPSRICHSCRICTLRLRARRSGALGEIPQLHRDAVQSAGRHHAVPYPPMFHRCFIRTQEPSQPDLNNCVERCHVTYLSALLPNAPTPSTTTLATTPVPPTDAGAVFPLVLRAIFVD